MRKWINLVVDLTVNCTASDASASSSACDCPPFSTLPQQHQLTANTEGSQLLFPGQRQKKGTELSKREGQHNKTSGGRETSLTGVPALNYSRLTRQTPGLVIFCHYLRAWAKQASTCVHMHMAEQHGKPLIIKFKYVPAPFWICPFSTLYLVKMPTLSPCPLLPWPLGRPRGLPAGRSSCGAMGLPGSPLPPPHGSGSSLSFPL